MSKILIREILIFEVNLKQIKLTMKKLVILSIITILGLSNSTQAQNIDFGIKTGLNISNINGGEPSRNNLFGLHAGVFAEIKLNEKFSFQPELLYSMQGSEVGNLLKIKLDYFSIPLMAKYFVTEKFSLEMGPQLSFLVNDKIEYNDNSIPDEDTTASSFDFGLNLGFGYNISDNFFTQVRYNYGITTISENPDIKNSIFQISLGYKL